MINTKFTKGPWEKVVGRTHCAIRTDSGVIADMRTVNGCYSHHNAHLIAAAPDMYAMLDRLRTADMPGEPEKLFSEIKNLLAKARGEND